MRRQASNVKRQTSNVIRMREAWCVLREALERRPEPPKQSPTSDLHIARCYEAALLNPAAQSNPDVTLRRTRAGLETPAYGLSEVGRVCVPVIGAIGPGNGSPREA